MKVSVVLGGIALGMLLAAGPARAQVVEAGVVIRSGPVIGHVVVAPRYASPVVVVERAYVPRGRAYGWWRGRGYRPVIVYYDGRRYYDRWVDGWGLRRIEVYQRCGHSYRWDD
jgi:hypothetical protein